MGTFLPCVFFSKKPFAFLPVGAHLGIGGAKLCADPAQITLYQIYAALEPEGGTSLIGIHPCQGRSCPVAQNSHKVLQRPYREIEAAVQATMEGITLQSMIDDFHSAVQQSDSLA